MVRYFLFVLILILIGLPSYLLAQTNLPISISKDLGRYRTGLINDIFVNDMGVWLGSENGFFGKIGEEVIAINNKNSLIEANFISDVEQYSHEELAFVAYGDGAYIFNSRTKSVRRLDLPEEVPQPSIWKIHIYTNLILIEGVSFLYVFYNDNVESSFFISDYSDQKGVEIVDISYSEESDKIWWLDKNRGLLSLDLKNKTVIPYSYVSRKESEVFTSMLIDEGKAYLGSSIGLIELDLTNREFFSVTKRNALKNVNVQPVRKIKKAPDGTLWVAAERLYTYNSRSKEFEVPDSLYPVFGTDSVKVVISLVFDKYGNLYGSDAENGFFSLAATALNTKLAHNNSSIVTSNIFDIVKLEDNYWAYTSEGNVSVYKPDLKRFLSSKLATKGMIFFLSSSDDSFRVIDEKANIFQVNYSGGTPVKAQKLPFFENNSITIHDVSMGYRESLILASIQGKKLLLYLSEDFLEVLEVSKSSNYLSRYFEESALLGDYSGALYSASFKDKSFKIYKYSDNYAWGDACVVKDRNGRVWLCSSGNGLRYISDTGSQVKIDFFEKDYVRGIGELTETEFLVSTNEGLFYTNIEKEETIALNSNFGVNDIDFEYDSVHSGFNHTFVRGDNYTYIFDNKRLLESIRERRKQYFSVSIVSVRNFSEKFGIYLEPPLSIQNDGVLEVTLPNEHVLAEVILSIPNPVEYNNLTIDYRLVDSGSFWTTSSTSNEKFIIPKLPHGNYTLEARVTNPYLPQPVTRLRITVLPPWWLSPFAYALYTVLLMIVVGCAALKLKQRYFEQGKVLKGEVNEKQSLLEDTQYYIHHILDRKQHIFANVARQLQTPLTLISGPVRQIIDNPEDEETPRRLEMIEDNAKRLHLLVNQITEIERLENIKKLPCQNYNLNTIFPQIVGNLRSLAELNNQRLEAHVRTRGEIYLLRDSLEKILLHLVTNALQCTPPEGKVQVSARCEGLHLVITVADNVGLITEAQAETIFQRFAQQHESGTADGSDIGLALVKELVLANQGWIDIETKPKKATCFTVYLPLVSLEEKSSPSVEPDISPPPSAPLPDHTLRPNIIIVDDDAALRSYLSERLGQDYCCIEADSVQAALDLMKVVPVALVVCDFRMPGESGLQLREKMQNQIQLQDIPFILLAALVDEAGLEGPILNHIDAIISKPVDTLRLQRQTESIMAREQARGGPREAQAQTTDNTTPFTLPTFDSARDQAFYMRFLKLLADHYQDDSFSRTFAAQQMATSERQMLRKLNALFGLNFTDTLKLYRLHQAKALLREGVQVTQVAYEVGFGTASYFSSCFKAQVNETPRQYQERCQQVPKSQAEA